MSEAEDRDQADAPGAGGEEEEEEEAGDPEMEANLNHLEEVQGELDKVRVCAFVRSHTNASRPYFRTNLESRCNTLRSLGHNNFRADSIQY